MHLVLVKRALYIYIHVDNEVYTWGHKSRGRLGNNDQDGTLPHKVDIKSGGLKLVSAAASNGGTILAYGNVKDSNQRV